MDTHKCFIDSVVLIQDAFLLCLNANFDFLSAFLSGKIQRLVPTAGLTLKSCVKFMGLLINLDIAVTLHLVLKTYLWLHST